MNGNMNRQSKLLMGIIFLLSSMAFANQARADFGIDAIEFSPARVISVVNGNEYKTISGTVLFSLPNPNTELAVPFLWSKNTDGFIYEDYNAITADLQWRKYDKPERTGGYIGMLLRVFNGSTENPLTDNSSETDVGVGVVAGFRAKISGGFYYGANMTLAAFPQEISNVDYGEHDFFRNQLSYTLDFLKIGYRF